MSSAPDINHKNKRGDATRERLVITALDLFGAKGFEGVGAREIAAAAGVPLGAIPYHFGTKFELYRAALERVRTELGAAIAPAVPSARQALHGTPEQARHALGDFKAALFDAIAVAPASEQWAKLLLREHLDPSDAFDIVYEDAAKGAVEMIAALIAHATGRDTDDEAVLIEAFAQMGEVLIFRTAQKAVLKRLGWIRFGKAEAGIVKDAL